MFVFYFSFLTAKPAESTPQSPFLWIVEKGGKSSYFLGTIHTDVSLDDMPCSDQILNQIQNSNLFFTELKANSDLENLSEEEERKLFIGSKEERKEIMSRLSLESQEIVREKEAILDNFLIYLKPYHIVSETNESFSELSPKSQTSLIRHGVNIQGNHADFYYFILRIVHYKLHFLFPLLKNRLNKLPYLTL